MKAIQGANLALMFFLELGVYAAMVAWSSRTSVPVPAKVGLGVAAVGGLATLWGLFAAPRAAYPIDGVGRLAFEVAWFGAGALALRAAGFTSWGLVLAGLYVGNGLLRLAWDQV